jgi:2-hydroxychromene-2-carboxylate isomerase
MPKSIDYYFTPVSPYSYLGHERLIEIAARHGATIVVKPVDFGRIFPASGGLPLKERLARPFNVYPKFFPVATDPGAKWILAAKEGDEADALRLAGALLRAVWIEERDISSEITLAAIASEQGLDADALAAGAASPAVSSRYDALTQEALDRQIFGAPTYVYCDELF